MTLSTPAWAASTNHLTWERAAMTYQSWMLGLSPFWSSETLPVVWGVGICATPCCWGLNPSPRPYPFCDLSSLRYLKAFGVSFSRYCWRPSSGSLTCSVFDTMITLEYMKWCKKKKKKDWYLSYPFIAVFNKYLWPGVHSGEHDIQDSTGWNTNIWHPSMDGVGQSSRAEGQVGQYAWVPSLTG